MTPQKTTVDGWQDSVEILIALWLFMSPFVLGFTGNSAATVSVLLIASFTLLIAQLGLAEQKPWEEWTNIILALLLIASPWLFGYAFEIVAMLNSVVSGVLIIVFAALSIRHEYSEMRLHH